MFCISNSILNISITRIGKKHFLKLGRLQKCTFLLFLYLFIPNKKLKLDVVLQKAGLLHALECKLFYRLILWFLFSTLLVNKK